MKVFAPNLDSIISGFTKTLTKMVNISLEKTDAEANILENLAKLVGE